MAIRFYSTTGAHGCFSNFSRHPFELGGKRWPTSEHYFQAQKFAGTPREEEIRCVQQRLLRYETHEFAAGHAYATFLGAFAGLVERDMHRGDINVREVQAELGDAILLDEPTDALH